MPEKQFHYTDAQPIDQARAVGDALAELGASGEIAPGLTYSLLVLTREAPPELLIAAAQHQLEISIAYQCLADAALKAPYTWRRCGLVQPARDPADESVSVYVLVWGRVAEGYEFTTLYVTGWYDFVAGEWFTPLGPTLAGAFTPELWRYADAEPTEGGSDGS